MSFRKTIILVFFAHIFLPAIGQNKDSLHRELKKAKSVVKKAKILEQLVDAWGITQMDSADHYLDIQIKLLSDYSKKSGLTKKTAVILAEALMRKSYILQSYDKTNEALQILKNALAIVKTHNELRLMNGVGNNLAFSYSARGQLDSSKYYYTFANQCAEKMKDSAALALGLTNQANVEVELGNNLEAEKQILRAIEIYKRLENKESIFGTYLIAAQMYDGMGNIKLSLDYYYKCLAIAEETKSDRNLTAIYNDIG
ncbi:MAG: tetratricopeptide repeat protein, partial [Flavobacteriales bacterium]